MFGNKTNSLLSKSANALGVFTKTLSDLKTINSQIETQDGALSDKQMKIQEERDSLSDVHMHNSKVISKIEDFLEN